MTPEQRKAIEILNKIRDFMKDELNEDDYMYLVGIVVDWPKTETIYVPPYRDTPWTWPQVTYATNAAKTNKD